MERTPLFSNPPPAPRPACATETRRPLSIRRDAIAALRVRTGVRAGYLGNNPGNQGRNHSH